MLPKTKRLESLNVQRAVKKKLSESSHVRIVKELEKQMSKNQNYMDFYQRDVNNIFEEIKITDQINFSGTRSKRN